MVPTLASVIALSALSGCSLLYNPNNLPTPPTSDAAEIDAYVADANPALIEVLDVGPAVLREGQGVGGARPAVLAIVGHHFVSPVTVELLTPEGLPRTPTVTVDNAAQQVAPGGDVVMVPVSIAVDTMLPMPADTRIPLTVKVTQGNGSGGTASAMLAGKLQLEMLPELDAVETDSAVVSTKLYSRVLLSGPIAFARGAGKPPAILRAVSAIEVGSITASANGDTPGAGGFAGGATSTRGGGAGAGNPGNTTTDGGAGAGFAANGSGGGGGADGGERIGDPLISSYSENYGSGGGGAAEPGGGGGGTVELSAGGHLVIANITAIGGNGGSSLTSGAGGGAGGAIVLRSGGTLSLPGGAAINAAGGQRGTGAVLMANGGDGSPGRIRIDAAKIEGVPTITAGALHVGASFDLAAPLATTSATPSLSIHGSSGDEFNARVFDASGAMMSISTFEITGQMGTAAPTLRAGYNRVCISPSNSGTNAESTTCLEIAYLP